jgi:DNA repair exonuclease SbcCD ATPase subunit
MINFSMSKIALGAAVLSTGLVVGFAWQAVSMRAELQRLYQQKKALADQVGRLMAQRQSAPPPRALRRSPDDSETSTSKPDAALVRSLADKEESITTLQRDLASTRGRVSELENTLLTLQGQTASRDQQLQQQFAAERASHNQLVDAEHSLELARNDLQEEKAKTSELESSNATLKAQINASASSPRTAELLDQLNEITRRRESCIREITSRYRDVTSQYQSLTGALAGGQNQQIAPWNSAELSRIQSAISSEEDNLRRLDELNAQAALVEKRLAKH